jgi:hypothetical protein
MRPLPDAATAGLMSNGLPPEQDQTEWQIEWQTAPARACRGLAGAGLCSCSGWSRALPEVTEPARGPWQGEGLRWHARDVLLRLAGGRAGLEGRRHLPGDPPERAAGHARDPGPHCRPRQAPARALSPVTGRCDIPGHRLRAWQGGPGKRDPAGDENMNPDQPDLRADAGRRPSGRCHADSAAMARQAVSEGAYPAYFGGYRRRCPLLKDPAERLGGDVLAGDDRHRLSVDGNLPGEGSGGTARSTCGSR